MSLTEEYAKNRTFNIYSAYVANDEEFLIIQENIPDIMSDYVS